MVKRRRRIFIFSAFLILGVGGELARRVVVFDVAAQELAIAFDVDA